MKLCTLATLIPLGFKNPDFSDLEYWSPTEKQRIVELRNNHLKKLSDDDKLYMLKVEKGIIAGSEKDIYEMARWETLKADEEEELQKLCCLLTGVNDPFCMYKLMEIRHNHYMSVYPQIMSVSYDCLMDLLETGE